MSQNPKDIDNPKSARDKRRDAEWTEKLNIARKTSLDATARFEQENATEPSTPMQAARVYTAKIEQLGAQSRLDDIEAENYSRRIDALKRTRPADDEEVAELLGNMRKKRISSAERQKKLLALHSEQATFLESTTNSTPLTRAEFLETILLTATRQARGEAESRNLQGPWKQSLVDFYDAGEPGSAKISIKNGVQSVRYAWLWCPVSGDYLPSTSVRAAHIAPKRLGPSTLSYLTGTTVDTTTLIGNGMLLATPFENALDQGHIILIPTGRTESPIELKLVLINEEMRNMRYSQGKNWSDVDGQILQFKNSARPQKRFLYLRYAMTILYAIRYKVPGYERLQSNFWPSRVIWASPGKYVRKSALQIVGGFIGEHFTDTFDDDEDSVAVSQNQMAKFRAVVDTPSSRNVDGEDAEDDDERE